MTQQKKRLMTAMLAVFVAASVAGLLGVPAWVCGLIGSPVEGFLGAALLRAES